MLACAGRAQCKQVIALVQHANTEPDRLDCPWLSNDFCQILQLLRCPEFELRRIAALVQMVGLQVLDGHKSILVIRRWWSAVAVDT